MPEAQKVPLFNYSMVFHQTLIPIWIENIAPLYSQFAKLKKSGIKDLRTYLADRPEEVQNLAAKIEVLDVNEATVKMYGAKNRDEFLGKLDQMMPTMDQEKFTEALVNFWDQDDVFNLESTHYTLDHKPFTVIASARIPKFDSSELIIPVTLTDITSLREQEQSLTEALEEIKTLRGIIPICASCKKIRDDSGYWNQIEKYICDRMDVMFTHGICPDCSHKLYPKEDKE